MTETSKVFLITIGTMLAVALVPLLIYALSSAGKDFSVKVFILTSRTRLFIGFVLMFLLSAILTLVPDTRPVLAAVGFGVGQSDAALGLAVGGLLVAAVRGDKK